MENLIKIFTVSLLAFVLSYIIIPFLSKIAKHIGLLDKPNARKVHQNPIPLVGGIAVALSMGLSLIVHPSFLYLVKSAYPILTCAFLLLFTGVIDDKIDVKASYKLIIQLACAYTLASAGIRITSFYGIFGVNELPEIVQYALTVLVVTGVVNAFNLMDGLDGLVGGLFIISFSCIAIIAFYLDNIFCLVISSAIIGSLLGFLRYNLSSKQRIFMGDGGSLFLSFILIAFSITLLEASKQHTVFDSSKLLAIVFVIFTIPVFDSLRVYLSRMKAGKSPFAADKSHLHHLFLLLGLPHKKVSLYISIISLYLVAMSVIGTFYLSPLGIIAMSIISFAVLAYVLRLNKNVDEWKKKLENMEKY